MPGELSAVVCKEIFGGAALSDETIQDLDDMLTA
jgi:hypothetical protein